MIRFDKITAPTFRSLEQKKTDAYHTSDNKPMQKTELLPDFKIPLAVNVPTGYTKLGVDKLDNGQEIHNYKLSNGLRVSILPMETNSTVINTFVNTGAINESDEERGISHFLEHMAFNGTYGSDGYKKLSTGDVFRIVGNIGGGTNASTNFALTDYYIQAPIFYDSDLEEIISIQGAMMNNLELSDAMIEKERGPVISEINMYTDFPDMLAYNMGLKNLYNLQTSSEDYVAGTTENIRNLTRSDVQEYYRKNYHPANMFTTLAGDVQPDEAIKLIAKHFHTKIENPPQKHVNQITPIQQPVRRDIISSKANEAHGFIMFNGPQNNNLKDRIAMEFVSQILFGNSNSRLEKYFTDTSIGMHMGMEKISTQPEDGQVVYFEFGSTEAEHEKALEKLYHELANFKTPSEATIERIKKDKLNRFDRQIKEPNALLGMLGHAHFTTGDSSLTQYKQTMKDITAEDIANCVNKYLDLNKASIAIVHPEKEIKATSGSVNFTGTHKKQILKPEKVNTYALGNNYNVATYDTNGDYKYITISINTPKIPEQKPGIAALLNEILHNGSEKLSRNNIDSFCSDYAISESISAAAGNISIYIAGNKNDIDKGLSLAKEILLRPNFTEEALKTAKENIRNRLKNFEPIAPSLILAEQFPDSPADYCKRHIVDNLDSITLDDVKNFHQQLIKSGCGTAAFTSDKDDANFNKKILYKLSTFPRAKVQTFKYEKSFEPNKTATTITHENNNAQADVAIGYKYNDNRNIKDYVIFKLLSSLLNKISFNDLREQQQLAYMVEAYDTRIADDNRMLFCNILTTTEDAKTGDTSYDNVQKSINGFLKLIEDLKAGNFSVEDFQAVKLQAKAQLLDLSDSDSMKIELLTGGIETPYGALMDNLHYKLIDTITKDDIIAAANHIFSNKPNFAVTGNKQTLEYNKEYFEYLKNNY